MLYRRRGVVIDLILEDELIQRLVVKLPDGQIIPAANYPMLTGTCQVNDEVLLNGTANLLNLGSGGWDFVLAILNRPTELTQSEKRSNGHLMKLRYTPLQIKVLAWEEESSPVRPTSPMNYGNLANTPVLIAGVHSLLEPTLRALSHLQPGCRTAYVMTDGACLPLQWSKSVTRLKEEGIITATITSGHAFGGDYEALNKYSALACSAEVVGADYIFVSMGPGIPGTGTKYGSTSLEVGEWVNAAAILGGRPVVIPRISTADSRPRHQGISHHFITALQEVALAPAEIGFPYQNQNQRRFVDECVTKSSLNSGQVRHIISYQDVSQMVLELNPYLKNFQSMGRNFADDPLHFTAGMAAALLAVSR